MIANQVLSNKDPSDYSGIEEDRGMIANQVLLKKDPSEQQRIPDMILYQHQGIISAVI